MTAEASRFATNYLQIDQTRANVEAITLDSTDLLIAFSSYEPRCREITKCKLGDFQKILVFRFTPVGEDNDREENFAMIADSLARFSKQDVGRKRLKKAIDVANVIDEIKAELLNEVRKKGGPLSITIDISSVPKVYLLFITAFLFRNGLAERISYFYSEASYPKLSEEAFEQMEYRSTDGRWLSYQVPYLEGRFHPARSRHAIVSMGSEAASLEKFLTRYDPDSVSLLSPVPGINAEFNKLAKKQAAFVKRNLGSVEVREIAALNVIGALPQVIDIAKERLLVDDVMMFSFGPKPQALVLGLAGLIVRDLPVVCRIPTRYVERKNGGNGWAWKYVVTDLSALPGFEIQLPSDGAARPYFTAF
jgi:hypothetical protein